MVLWNHRVGTTKIGFISFVNFLRAHQFCSASPRRDHYACGVQIETLQNFLILVEGKHANVNKMTWITKRLFRLEQQFCYLTEMEQQKCIRLVLCVLGGRNFTVSKLFIMPRQHTRQACTRQKPTFGFRYNMSLCDHNACFQNHSLYFKAIRMDLHCTPTKPKYRKVFGRKRCRRKKYFVNFAADARNLTDQQWKKSCLFCCSRMPWVLLHTAHRIFSQIPVLLRVRVTVWWVLRVKLIDIYHFCMNCCKTVEYQWVSKWKYNAVCTVLITSRSRFQHNCSFFMAHPYVEGKTVGTSLCPDFKM